MIPGAEFEVGVSDHRTLAITGGLWNVGISGSDKRYTIASPFFSYRNYYNLESRLENGKNTNDFSSNYISLIGKYVPKFGEHYGNKMAFGAAWGLQRNFGKLFHFGFDIGLLYAPNGYFRKVKNDVVPHSSLQFGVLFK